MLALFLSCPEFIAQEAGRQRCTYHPELFLKKEPEGKMFLGL